MGGGGAGAGRGRGRVTKAERHVELIPPGRGVGVHLRIEKHLAVSGNRGELRVAEKNGADDRAVLGGVGDPLGTAPRTLRPSF